MWASLWLTNNILCFIFFKVRTHRNPGLNKVRHWKPQTVLLLWYRNEIYCVTSRIWAYTSCVQLGQSIAGLTERGRQLFTITFTPRANFELPVNLIHACLWTVGRPRVAAENMQTPRRKARPADCFKLCCSQIMFKFHYVTLTLITTLQEDKRWCSN